MTIDLKDIITVSGQSGLFKLIAITQQEIVLESLDEHKRRSIKHIQRHNISTLENIGIYVMDKEETIPLANILWKLHADFGGAIPSEVHDTVEKRRALIQRIVPNYDPKKVYESSIKKLFQWYNILMTHAPTLFKAVQNSSSADTA